MKKTAISTAVGVAISILCGQTLAASIFATDSGTNTVPVLGDHISLSQPNRGFFVDIDEKTTMFALVAAQGNGTDQANAITIGDENTLTVNIDATANIEGTPAVKFSKRGPSGKCSPFEYFISRYFDRC